MEDQINPIAPYNDQQVKEALISLETNMEFIRGVQFFYPKWSQEEIVLKLRACNDHSDFMVKFIEMIIKDSIQNSMDSFEIIGLDNIDVTNSLFISNHRDIFLDSALLQNHLYDIGKPFTEISLGDNLMVNPTLRAVAKLSNMFTVIRNGQKSELLSNSINLSKYLRYTITGKKVSSWIAQRNGRTKDGNDVTATGLIKMLLLSGGNNIKKSILDLNIVVSTISFEYEPCAFEKANELSALENNGEYKKKTFENIESIIRGIKESKGKVKLVFEKLDVDKIDFTNNKKHDAVSIANEIDKIVYKNYQLRKTNYIAYDLLNDENKYNTYYSQDELTDFKEYLSGAEDEDIYLRVLKMYVNPLMNKKK